MQTNMDRAASDHKKHFSSQPPTGEGFMVMHMNWWQEEKIKMGVFSQGAVEGWGGKNFQISPDVMSSRNASYHYVVNDFCFLLSSTTWLPLH